MSTTKLLAGAAAAALIPAGALADTHSCDLSTTRSLTSYQTTTTTNPCPELQGSSSAEPRYGSPNSITFQNASVSLDLFDFDPEVATGGAFLPEGDADTVGGALTYYKAGYQKGQRLDLHYQRARRLGQRSRARLLIDVPISINHADKFNVQYTVAGTPVGAPISIGGHSVVYGTVNVGVEIPVNPNFFLTPRVSYSNSQAGAYFAYDAEFTSASVTARYKLPQVGRGDLTLGGVVAYSHTINTFLAKQPFYQNADYWTLRGGLAYQLPLKRRMFGRQASIRASYVFTYLTGEPFMTYKQLHEVGINVGVRTREAEQKNRFEQMRVGLLYTHTRNEFTSKADADAVTLTLGYRF